MSEILRGLDFERESLVTRARVMNGLNHSANAGKYDVQIDADMSGIELFGMVHVNPYEGPLELWTEDLLTAFRIEKARWQERVLVHDADQEPTPEQELGTFLRQSAYAKLTRQFTDGYAASRFEMKLRLEDSVYVDLIAEGQAWEMPGAQPEYDFMYTALFRRTA